MSARHSFRPIILALLCALPSATLGPSPARAHAFLDHAEPRAGSTVVTPPEKVTLCFSEPIEPSFSRIEVRDAAGRRVDTGEVEHPAADTLRVTLRPLLPGTYRVHWVATSVDAHETRGGFRFSVAE